MQDYILETNGLMKEFKGFVAVNGVNLRARRADIHALIGPNGAGKTTCFNLLTKFLEMANVICPRPPTAPGSFFATPATLPPQPVLSAGVEARERPRWPRAKLARLGGQKSSHHCFNWCSNKLACMLIEQLQCRHGFAFDYIDHDIGVEQVPAPRRGGLRDNCRQRHTNPGFRPAPTRILDTDDLRKRFKGFQAVLGICLAVETESIHSIIGPTGAGKPPFLNLICKFIAPTSSIVCSKGCDLTEENSTGPTNIALAAPKDLKSSMPRNPTVGADIASMLILPSSFKKVNPTAMSAREEVKKPYKSSTSLDFHRLFQSTDAFAAPACLLLT